MTATFFGETKPIEIKIDRPICTVAVDAEEDFNWDDPTPGTRHSTTHIKNVRVLHEIVSAYGIVPTYLLTYPVLDDPRVVRIIQRQLEQGQCALGIQLHPWVTPPLDDEYGPSRPYSGNLAASLEEKKLIALKEKFRTAFGFEAKIFRAGRYGLSKHTALLLEKHGFDLDTSVAPRTSFASEGGPDYSDYDCEPFWFGTNRRLLELPLCRSVVGWAGRLAPALYRTFSTHKLAEFHAVSFLTRSRCAERITLSPEGNDRAAMLRLIHGLRARGQSIFVLSFHSSSLNIGRNPYVQSKADLHHFYDRLSATLDDLATRLHFQFASIPEIWSRLQPAGAPDQHAAVAP